MRFSLSDTCLLAGAESRDNCFSTLSAMSKTILIVDDYADIRTLMKILIEMAGYRVLEAHDGIEALEPARDKHPDLILMDIAMPGMNGITAAQQIRTFEHCA